MDQTLRIEIMLGLLLAIFFVPVKVAPRDLLKWAFSIWLIGGLMLIFVGTNRLLDPDHGHDPGFFWGMIALGCIIGVAKGKFVLSKTSSKNIERISAMTEPRPLRELYSIRSWILIAVMLGLSFSLNIMDVSLFWRGVVNLGIGFALLMSSLAYWRALGASNSHA